jgi:nucleoid-associated protein YgaU
VNRENKLAIIIGFSLVLVVAVLISDHFSRARTVEIGSEMKPGTPEDFGASTVGLTRPIGNQDIISANSNPLLELNQRVSHTAEKPAALDDPTHDGIVMGPSGVEQLKTPGPKGADGEKPGIVEPMPDASVPPKPISEGVMRSHDVKDGDKLFRIAAKYYGDGTYWEALAKYNKTKLPKPESLRVGIKLDIPPKDVLLGEAVMPPPGMTPKRDPVKEGTGGRPKGEKPMPAPPQIARNEKLKIETPKDKKKSPLDTYKIVRGDDLSSIAKKLLGDAKRANELYKLNRDVLEDEHTLLAGTVIKVPAR